MGDLTKNFSRSEFACKCGCGFDTIDYEVLNRLEDLRLIYNAPITINSACRCAKHNKVVGGKSSSMHLKGRAVDFVVKGKSPFEVYDDSAPHWKGGLGRYSTFTHIDSRGRKARWG